MNSKIQQINNAAILGPINENVGELTPQVHIYVLNVKEERDDNRLDSFNDAFSLVQKRGAPPLGRFELPDNLFPYRRRGECVLSTEVCTKMSKCL